MTRLKVARKVKLPEPGKPLSKVVPQLPAGKFDHIPGQQAIDFDSDDPNALTDPEQVA